MSASEEIKKRMAALGMSQNALARKAGLSQSGLSTILSGKARPREDSMEAVAKALNCKVADFYGIEKAPDEPGLNEFIIEMLKTMPDDRCRVILDFLELSDAQQQRVIGYLEAVKAMNTD